MYLKEMRSGFLAEIKLAKGLIHLWYLTNTGRKVTRFGLKSCLSSEHFETGILSRSALCDESCRHRTI